MTVAHPWLLLLLLPAAAVVWLTLRGRGYSRGRFAFLAALRMLLAACAMLAVAGIAIHLPSPERHVVFLIDDSPSFADRAPSAEALVRERIKTLGPDDVATVLHFDRAASADSSRRKEDATNIESALDAAAAAIPDGQPGAVFLLSDGIETAGDASRAAVRLAARGIPVYVPRPSTTATADVRVSSLQAPPTATPGRAVRITCRIDATRRASAQVEISRQGKVVARETVAVSPDAPAAITAIDTPPGEGLAVYTAHVTSAEDRFPQNNSLSVSVFVTGPPRILYLSGYANETPAERLLKSLSTLRFERVDAAGLTPERLAEASCVIIENYPEAKLAGHAPEIARFVRDAGGGLIIIGGPGSFGEGGYIDTSIDSVLPVHCDPREADKKPIALVVLLDSSGSMGESGGEKMETARAAAMRTLAHLTPADLAAVIAFRVTPEVVMPLGPVGDPSAAARRLAGISPNGGTNIFPAIDEAAALLASPGVKAPLRHVLLLSDGKSLRSPGDAEAAVDRCLKAGITLSTVATGADADGGLLRKLALDTKGRFYEAKSMSDLADLFLDDLRRIDGPLVRKGALNVEPADVSALPGAPGAGLPTVAAYNRARLRDGASLVMKHAVEGADEPLVAVGRSGLGRSAAITLSFDKDWAGGLSAWPDWGRLLVAAVRHVERTQQNAAFSLTITREGGYFDIAADAEAGTSLLPAKPVARVSGATGPAVDIPLTRTGALRWTGALQTEIDSVATVALVDGATVLASTYAPTAYPREFRAFAPRLDVLQNIASVTGGQLVDSLAAFRTAGGRAPTRERDATLWLLAAALFFYFIELAGRAAGRL